ncbi:MAG: hypothetical protein GX751_07335 [Desulfuromonadaceae bacterium]|nr:hypothetical protein [Desulfuromonadaceae bacterium]
MKNEPVSRQNRTIALASRRSRLAPRWLRRLHRIGHSLPRFIAWLTNLPHFSLIYLILIAGTVIFLRVAFDTDPLSGLVVAAVGGPLFSLAFCLILPLLMPLFAFQFLMIRGGCRILARLGGWILPDPHFMMPREKQIFHHCPILAATMIRKNAASCEDGDRPVRFLLAKVAALWARE